MLALLPACAVPRVINCQGITAYTMKTLQTTCLNRVSHQHATQDLTSSATLHHPAPREAIGDWILPAKSQQSQNAMSDRGLDQPPSTKWPPKERPSDEMCPSASDVERPDLVMASQRSLHNAPIFRLLLKVAVNGTHQCDYSNFCGNFGSQPLSQFAPALLPSATRFERARACASLLGVGS